MATNVLGGSTSGINKVTSGTPNGSIGIVGGSYNGAPNPTGSQNSLIATPPAQLTLSATPYAAAAPDTTAADAARAAAAARGDYSTALNSTNASINDAISGAGAGYNSSILDYLDSRKAGQANIDSERVQNELARQGSMQDILDMVGNGVKSGGVILANSGAGSSSAGEALARAYGIQGRQQASKVGNQFAQGADKINTEQGNLVAADATELRHANESKVDTINGIVNSARSQLSALNASAASASLPDRIDIENRIAQIKQQAMDALTSYDAQLSNVPQAQSDDQVRAKASSLLNAGTAPENAFDYTTEVPTQFQGTGQFASSLPIFTSPNRKNTNL